MLGLFIAMGCLLYLVMLVTGVAKRFNESVASAGRGIAQGAGTTCQQVSSLAIRPCFDWFTGERLVFGLRFVGWVAYMAVIMAMLAMVYWTLSAEGLRRAVPDLGIKLWNLPFLAGVGRFNETKGLDLAHIVALMLMLCSLYIVHEVSKMHLGIETCLRRHSKNPDTYEVLVRSLAMVMLAIDLGLFYIAVTQSSWSSTVFNLKAFLVSVGYICVLIVVTLGSILLEPFAKRRISDAAPNTDDPADSPAIHLNGVPDRMHAGV